MLAAGFSKVSKETLGVYPGVAGTGEVTDGDERTEARERGEPMDKGIVGGDGEESREVRVVAVSIMIWYCGRGLNLATRNSLNAVT